MHYLFSYTGDDWFAEFTDKEVGYGFFVDRDMSVVLVTHGDAEGHLPCIERHDQWVLLALVDKVACCYPAQVQRRFPGLNVIGNWDEQSWVSSFNRGADHLVSVFSDTENTRMEKRNGRDNP